MIQAVPPGGIKADTPKRSNLSHKKPRKHAAKKGFRHCNISRKKAKLPVKSVILALPTYNQSWSPVASKKPPSPFSHARPAGEQKIHDRSH
ncbi:hypothetical protein [uncultured Desulfuromonas sp.]|uniref:hypothetical protein n=1 Tax=uncultured Desulfuromonas sp. TaxID=181013 RepID=UPI002AAC4AAD|nr:hypothetical protein [uncultured Desulfuromonas sp.]